MVISIRSSLLSYMCSFLPSGNHSAQEKLGEEFYKRWETTTFKGPFLEAIIGSPPVRTGNGDGWLNATIWSISVRPSSLVSSARPRKGIASARQ